jgi:N-acetylmuramoyl-L-alanine amidase
MAKKHPGEHFFAFLDCRLDLFPIASSVESVPSGFRFVLRTQISMSLRAITFSIAVCFVWLWAGAPNARAWEVVKVGGRDYVTARSIKEFYGFSKMSRCGNTVKLENKAVVMKLSVGKQECLMNNVKFIFSYKVESQGSKVLVSRIDLAKLVDPVLRPNYIHDAGNFRTVILDPGHGGKDSGATSPYGTEKNYNLKLARRLKPLLEKAGFKVVITRNSDRFISLQERVNIANRVKEGAVFISLHFNSGGRRARGIETFTLSPRGVAHYGRGLLQRDFKARAGNHQDSANIALATAVHGSVLRRLGKNTFDRGIKRARFSVLTGVRHPAILFEGGFMSHPYESRLIANEAYQNALARGIVLAVCKYRKAVACKAARPTRARAN